MPMPRKGPTLHRACTSRHQRETEGRSRLDIKHYVLPNAVKRFTKQLTHWNTIGVQPPSPGSRNETQERFRTNSRDNELLLLLQMLHEVFGHIECLSDIRSWCESKPLRERNVGNAVCFEDLNPDEVFCIRGVLHVVPCPGVSKPRLEETEHQTDLSYLEILQYLLPRSRTCARLHCLESMSVYCLMRAGCCNWTVPMNMVARA